MAKKAKKKAPAKPAPKPRLIKKNKAAKPARPARPARPATERRTGPRSVALPGMEQVRYKDLDGLCESIAETREAINRYKGEEADLERQALQRMRSHESTTYTWSGVTLMRVPGEETLIVRNARQRKATAEAPVETAAGEGPGETVDEAIDGVDNGGDDTDVAE